MLCNSGPGGLRALLLGVLSVAVVASSGVTAARLKLGSSKCTYGPSYWCQSLDTSSSCGATSHCIQKVWQAYPAPEDKDSICDICKEMVKEARDQLMSNETTTELKEVLEGSCDLIPIKIISKECKKLADQFVPELVEILSSEMDPATVCTVAKLCNNEDIDEMLMIRDMASSHQLQQQREAIQGALSDPVQVCTLCSSATMKMGAQVARQADEQVLTTLLMFCGELGSTYADACKMTVIHNAEMLISSLRGLDDQVCYDLSLCSKGVYPQPQSLEAVTKVLGNPSDGIECEFCKSIVNSWLDEFRNNSTIQELQQLMDNVCSKLGKQERIDRCKIIVDNYYIPLLKELADNIDATTVCAMASLCKSPQSGLDQLDVTVLIPYDLEPAVRENALEDINPVRANKNVSDNCATCQLVMDMVLAALSDKSDQEEIKNLLESACAALPGKAKDRCEAIIEKYAEAIIDYIAKGFSPEDICKALSLCSKAPTNPNGQNCVICEFVIKTVDQMLSNETNVDEVKKALGQVCAILPKTVYQQCHNFVESYTDAVIDMFVKKLSPELICTALGICQKDPHDVIKSGNIGKKVRDGANSDNDEDSSESHDDSHDDSNEDNDDNHDGSNEEDQDNSRSIQKPQAEVSDGDDYYCMLCEYFVSEAKTLIGNNTDATAVEKVLDNLCLQMSGTVRLDCLDFVHSKSDEMIKMFVAGENPTKICTKMRMCRSQRPPTKRVKATPADAQEIMSNDIESMINGVGGASSRSSSLKARDSVKKVQKVRANQQLCPLCEYALDVIENQLLGNDSLKAVEAAVRNVCYVLPSTISKDCAQFVDKYGDKIIEEIAELKVPPKKICTDIGICSASELWDASTVGGKACIFGPALWCASSVHASICGTVEYCASLGML